MKKKNLFTALLALMLVCSVLICTGCQKDPAQTTVPSAEPTPSALTAAQVQQDPSAALLSAYTKTAQSVAKASPFAPLSGFLKKGKLTASIPDMLKNELLISESMEKTVMHYAANAKKAGLDGVVCSPLEAGKVHEALGADFLTVTPGVRFADGDKGHQKRVTTPEKARELGSDYIVVGRPITAAEDPVKAYERCVKEFLG